MTIAANLRAKPRLPVMAGPMFIASTADLVNAASVGDVPYPINLVAHASNSRLSAVVQRTEPGGTYIAWLVADYVAARVAMGIPA
ncbi:MAG: hypothetical protein Q8R44_11675 [Novosphingobium sp.]|nr:hypothetical protein [Novosphingobium sp.]